MDFRKKSQAQSIVLHEYFPYAAIASYDVEGRRFFVDCEDMSAHLKPFYTILDAAFLEKAFDPPSNDLAEFELKQVKAWGATQNGDVLFNHWD